MATHLDATPGTDRRDPDGPGPDRYLAVRRQTVALCEPLTPEDYVLQPMTEASPAKWHLAHTTWFFETFVLKAADGGYRPSYPEYNFLFNSYYNAVGERLARDRRGLLSRPTVEQVYRYRDEVDDRMLELLDGPGPPSGLGAVVELGLQHEQQHQELILTDLKAALACNPLRPAYRDDAARPQDGRSGPQGWTGFEEGLREVGHDDRGFAFDNEGPRHRVYLEAFELAARPSTNGEYLAFLDDGGYERPELWLSDGWAAVRGHGWSAPLYWERRDGRWWAFTLGGMRPVVESEPVTHLSYYEADAFARWSGARLPTEAEWEVAAVASGTATTGNFVESSRFHPAIVAGDGTAPRGMFGDGWEWTASPYTAYPGFRTAPGALGEYNGKFMCNQFVLRGGSCATPRDHVRATYRNFFPPESRWQFAGVRLAKDARS